MNIRSSIRLVCFDLGGVLIRICRSWREGCQAAGIDIRGEWHNGYPQIENWGDLCVQFDTGRIDGKAWAAQVSRGVNHLYSPEEVTAIHDAWLLGEYEGVLNLVDEIHECGLQTAALSNTNPDHWPFIVQYPTIQRLHHRFASFLLGMHKPTPEIYREVQKLLRLDGSEILFFDDLPQNIEGARSCGWNAVFIDPHSRTDVQICNALEQYKLK